MINKICSAGAALALASTASFAADLPARTAPPVFVPPPALYNWTGLEFGLTTNLSFASDNRVSTFGPTAFGPATLNKFGSDYIGGGVGYNYQFTPGSGFVVGVMADASYFNLASNTLISDGAGDLGYFHQRISYLGTLNGRVGYAFDRVLIYGTGGVAFGGVHLGGGVNTAGAWTNIGGTNSTSGGYDVGAGLEYAIPPDSFLNYLSVEKILGLDKTLGLNMFDSTIRVEAVHYDLGSKTVVLAATAGGAAYVSNFKTEGNLVRLGLGYKFTTPAPVAARY